MCREWKAGSKNQCFYWVWALVSRGVKGRQCNGSPRCSREIPEQTQGKAPSRHQLTNMCELAEFAAGRVRQCWCWSCRAAPHTQPALSTELQLPCDPPCWTSLERWGQHRKFPLGTHSPPANSISLMEYLCSVQRAPGDTQGPSNAHFTTCFPQVSLPSSSLCTNISLKPRLIMLSEDSNYLHAQVREALIKTLSFICIISAKNIFMG